MKLITLWQPWASLMAIGAKRIETRGWSTDYRGLLAIHAAQSWNNDSRELATSTLGWNLLASEKAKASQSAPGNRPTLLRRELPFGAIIALCDLVDCRPMEWCGHCAGCGFFTGDRGETMGCPACQAGGVVPRGMRLSEAESCFGNYAPGRHALVTANMRRLTEPIPFRSRLGKLLDIPVLLQMQIASRCREATDSGGDDVPACGGLTT